MMYFVEEGESHDEINPQISDTTCGQVCIAMIAGKEIQEVIRDMKTSGSTSIGQLIEILDQYQIQHAEKKQKDLKEESATRSAVNSYRSYGCWLYSLDHIL